MTARTRTTTLATPRGRVRRRPYDSGASRSKASPDNATDKFDYGWLGQHTASSGTLASTENLVPLPVVVDTKTRTIVTAFFENAASDRRRW